VTEALVDGRTDAQMAAKSRQSVANTSFNLHALATAGNDVAAVSVIGVILSGARHPVADRQITPLETTAGLSLTADNPPRPGQVVWRVRLRWRRP
jgi:hypothetical protein